MITITIAIIILTCVISFTAFSNEKVTDDLIFYPPAVTNRNQWYRFITCGFIHADFMHLFFNMYSFYLFGNLLERVFNDPVLFGEQGKLFFILLYISALFVCLLPTYLKHKDDYHYRSLGASGAVSAVIFAGIFFISHNRDGYLPYPIQYSGLCIWSFVPDPVGLSRQKRPW